ncbi:aldo/keto reductase [Leifsonia poae]|uniref:aldo/keto reductase n=1 Tax=Leifsonia poae TaxID=110933 RepID=UPI001CBF09BA|nr:aldo/keto reductase [Leifsonia poae]
MTMTTETTPATGAAVQRRTFGPDGPDVSILSIGSWNTYSRLSFEAGVALVQHALELGIDTFDVAYYRDKPHTEVLFGRILEVVGAPRERYRIVEKTWFSSYPERSLAAQLDATLVRLGLNDVDVILSEHPRPGMDVQAIAEEVADLVVSGRARAWGGMDWSPEQLRIAYEHLSGLGLPTPQGVQLKYSIARQAVVEGSEFQTLHRDTGITLMASDTMEGGILAGKLAPERRIGIDTGNIREQIIALVPDLQEVAAGLGCSAAQLALAFCLSNDAVSTVLFGATRPEHLDDGVAALGLRRRLGAEHIRELLLPYAVSGHKNDAPYEHAVDLTADFIA